ncbi:DMT family transporter [Bermanella sp. WJH001]|uniref:DMT family transporter n=1 Tax=Bermanella sp. WJH001 TaxID=3048005 RepID=UPI0024BE2C1E|nr:DMT family transporter [Bermanella sp. WJH001]MDJ1538156.1 DMT family transporter [Bermanella sp. WJH001]
MKVASVYLSVVLIWSTTPLFIKLSVDSLDYIQASALRMWLSLVLCFLMMRLLSVPFRLTREAMYRYFVGATAVSGAMLCVYWSAQSLPSGLVAVVWGLSPLVVSLYSMLLIPQTRLSVLQMLCMLLAVFGLYYIFAQGVAIGAHLVMALLVLLLGVNFHSVSSVLLQRVRIFKPENNMHPLEQTTGALLLSAPVYGLMWLVLSGPLPDEISDTSIMAILYLATLGSVAGFIGYYYLLNKMSASSVALITIITPVLALMLGAYVAQEALHERTWIGAGFILLALTLYHYRAIMIVVKRLVSGGKLKKA